MRAGECVETWRLLPSSQRESPVTGWFHTRLCSCSVQIRRAPGWFQNRKWNFRTWASKEPFILPRKRPEHVNKQMFCWQNKTMQTLWSTVSGVVNNVVLVTDTFFFAKVRLDLNFFLFLVTCPETVTLKWTKPGGVKAAVGKNLCSNPYMLISSILRAKCKTYKQALHPEGLIWLIYG